MKALDALHSRTSAPRLTEPLPDSLVLENIYKAAFRAADHALLRPWRFLIIEGESRDRLGDLLVKAAREKDGELSEEQEQKLRRKPHRAPLIVVCISSYNEHPKVPQLEQDLSAGAATQNMLNAAHAQGVGAMWRTGSMAYNQTIMDGLGLTEQEKIIGFLYLGTINGNSKKVSLPEIDDFFQTW